MGHIKQVRRFGIVLFASSLALFIMALITKLWILMILGWLSLTSGWIVKLYLVPKLKKEKKRRKANNVTDDTNKNYLTSLKDYLIGLYDKFIFWLNN